MPTYIVRFHTQIEVSVEIDAEDEDVAGDDAWQIAEDYLKTVHGQGRLIVASATLDGIGATEVELKDAAGVSS